MKWDTTIIFFDDPAITSVIEEYVDKGLVDNRWEYNPALEEYTSDTTREVAAEIQRKLWDIGEDIDIINY